MIGKIRKCRGSLKSEIVTMIAVEEELWCSVSCSL